MECRVAPLRSPGAVVLRAPAEGGGEMRLNVLQVSHHVRFPNHAWPDIQVRIGDWDGGAFGLLPATVVALVRCRQGRHRRCEGVVAKVGVEGSVPL